MNESPVRLLIHGAQGRMGQALLRLRVARNMKVLMWMAIFIGVTSLLLKACVR